MKMKSIVCAVVLVAIFCQVYPQVQIPAYLHILPYNQSHTWNNSYNQPQWNNSWNNQPTRWNNSWNNQPNNTRWSTPWTNPVGYNPGVYNPGGYNSGAYNPWNNSATGDLLLGNVGPYDKELFSEVFVKTSRWWAGRDKTIDYVSKSLPRPYITAIIAHNMGDFGNGTKARLLKGGIGQSFATIYLSSNRGYGFKYLVKIYGRN